MTRFARAKGSKASNERVALEPTPWHILKEQLESAVEREEQVKEKTKSAKQLLSEKEEPFYTKSLGNVNHDWAEFDKPKNKTKKNGKVEKKTKDNSLNLKEVIGKNNLEKCSVSELKAEGENSLKKFERKNEKLLKENSQHDRSSSNTRFHDFKKEKLNNNNKTEDPENKIKKREKVQQNLSRNDSRSHHLNEKKQKKKKTTMEEHENTQKIADVKTTSNNETNKQIESINKLSKRQKRNLKRKTQDCDDRNGTISSSTFNSNGNDENDSVSPNKKQKSNNNKGSIGRNIEESDENLDRKNFRRFGNNVPKKFQKKAAKIRDDEEHKRRKPDVAHVKVIINGMEVEIVKYDGFPVKKEDAKRLIELKKQMVLKGIPKADIDAAMKLERRKCEKALARLRKHVCFHCRKAGHNLSDCPELEKEEMGTGICFKCGSTEHTHFECKVNRSDEYRYAKCFICREQGHIAKQCPDNPKGLYPDGGACKICGDVTHLKKDCPDLTKEKEDTAITLGTIRDSGLELLDDEKRIPKEVKQTKKIVTF